MNHDAGMSVSMLIRELPGLVLHEISATGPSSSGERRWLQLPLYPRFQHLC